LLAPVTLVGENAPSGQLYRNGGASATYPAIALSDWTLQSTGSRAHAAIEEINEGFVKPHEGKDPEWSR
jgi:hypothetical protein